MRSAHVVSVLAVTLCLQPGAAGADVPVAPPPRLVVYTAPTPRPAGFTGEVAKRALIDLMETRPGGLVSKPDIKKFGDEAVKVYDYPGVAGWGPFTLNLAEMKYEFTTGNLTPPNVWIMGYEGSF